MPYIDQKRRDALDGEWEAGTAFPETPRTSGELNYVITSAVEDFLMAASSTADIATPTYAMFNAAIGALECAKLELYQRAVAPYENIKAKENGDIPLYEDMSRKYYASLLAAGRKRMEAGR